MLQSVLDSLFYFFFGANCDCAELAALNFFLLNTIRASLILLLLSAFISVVKSRLKAEKLGRFLESKNFFGAQYVAAALFGAATPFCSCSSVSIFIALIAGKVPFGVACSFLICSPLVNEFALAMLLNSFGYSVAFAYLFAGLFMASLGGYLFDLFGLKKYLANVDSATSNMCDCAKRRMRDASLEKGAKRPFVSICLDSLKLLAKVAPYLVLGVGLAALIKAWMPENFFEKYLAVSEVLAVPLSVAFGLPVYANNVAIVPLLESLVDKGVPLGVAISFMMASVGLSLPEMAMLKSVFSLKLIAIFALSLAFMMILAGYFFCLIY